MGRVSYSVSLAGPSSRGELLPQSVDRSSLGSSGSRPTNRSTAGGTTTDAANPARERRGWHLLPKRPRTPNQPPMPIPSQTCPCTAQADIRPKPVMGQKPAPPTPFRVPRTAYANPPTRSSKTGQKDREMVPGGREPVVCTGLTHQRVPAEPQPLDSNPRCLPVNRPARPAGRPLPPSELSPHLLGLIRPCLPGALGLRISAVPTRVNSPCRLPPLFPPSVRVL